MLLLRKWNMTPSCLPATSDATADTDSSAELAAALLLTQWLLLVAGQAASFTSCFKPVFLSFSIFPLLLSTKKEKTTTTTWALKNANRIKNATRVNNQGFYVNATHWEHQNNRRKISGSNLQTDVNQPVEFHWRAAVCTYHHVLPLAPLLQPSCLSGANRVALEGEQTALRYDLYICITKAQHLYLKKKNNNNRANAQLQGGLGNCAMLGTLR